MSAAMSAAAVECRYTQEHPKLEAELTEHRRRIEVLEKDGREDRRELWQTLGRLEKSVENMKGWLTGAMLAATMLGAIVAFMATKVLKA